MELIEKNFRQKMIKKRTKKSLDDSIGVHVHKNREKPAFSKKYRNLFDLI
jgi:hypothetical protein